MSRKSAVSPELVIDVFKRLMMEIDNPTPLVIPEGDDGLEDLDGFTKLLMTASAPITKSSSAVAASEPVSGTKPITIRLQNRVVNAFKARAAESGASYQTLMHRALADAAEEFAL